MTDREKRQNENGREHVFFLRRIIVFSSGDGRNKGKINLYHYCRRPLTHAALRVTLELYLFVDRLT